MSELSIIFRALNWDFFLIAFCLESINRILELLFDDKKLYQLGSFYYFVGLQMLLSFG